MAEPKPTRKNSSQVESSPTFEESLSQLEASVRVLEAGDLELERAIEVYIKGVEHVKACQSKLSDVEQRLEVLGQGGPGRQTSDTGRQQS
jgi:exodeoxyribonuclease VII small subunit